MSKDETTNPQSPIDVDPPPIIVASARQNDNEMDKLYTPYIGSKSTQVVRQNKTMTPITEKLEEMHADLWGPHDPPS